MDKNKKNLIVSFSGGRTSGYMSWWLKNYKSDEYNLYFVFANTGQEDERTLDFVHECDVNFDLNLVWLESVVHHGKRQGCTHKVVNYETAHRGTDLFEEMIKKYGIPNKSYPHCNRELKLNPIKSWMRENGLKKAFTAIGIRVDEMDRMSVSADKNRLIYPLVSMAPQTKDGVRYWWSKQSFDLDVEEHYGNCVTCFKKSDRKLMTLAKTNPRLFQFNDDMEQKYGTVNCKEGTNRVFFRSNTSARKLVGRAHLENFEPFKENSQEYQPDLDLSNGCSESCDIYSE